MEKRILQKIIPVIALSILAVTGVNDYFKEPHVVINEVCSNNFAVQMDGNGEYPDCIELYNPGGEAVSLDGCFLTDDEKEMDKYSLEGVLVPAGGYALVWLEKDSELRISKDGEKIFLADSSLRALDQVMIPRLSYDTSYGRIQDGKYGWSVMKPTLGSSNEETELLPVISLDEPIFEVTSGFYEEAFALHLYSPNGEKIYYTLDGSEPAEDSFLYENSIWITDNSQEENRYAGRTDLTPTKDYTPDFPVDKAVVVRALCYNPVTNQTSNIVTETYFVGYNEKPEYAQMAVMSLVVNPEDLFDNQTGIYGNGMKYEDYLTNGGMRDGEILDSYEDAGGEVWHRYMASNAFYKGREWERGAFISYFDETHACCFSQNVGVRISGNSTRSAPQKSFNIFARDIYDETEVIPYAFFDNDIIASSVKIRNGGGNGDGLKFLDALLEEAVGDKRAVTIQRAKPCVVFLNGEYWGIYSIRERYNAEYLANYFNIDADDIMLVKAGSAVTNAEETMTAYQYMLDVVTECDLTYDDTYALAGELIDIQSLIDYCCINLYLDNRDTAFGYNTALWRTTQEGTDNSDGKWRFMLYDLDECIHQDSNVWENRENWMEESALFSESAVASLMDNEDFRRQFCITFMDLANTTFSYERMHSMLADWSGIYSAQVVKDHWRFYDAEYDVEAFYAEAAQADAFFKERFRFAMESLAKTFDLSGELTRISITSNLPKGGTIIVNTAELEENGSWEGYYYSDFPVTVSAHAKEGYRFAGWQGDIDSETEELHISPERGTITLQALFEKDN